MNATAILERTVSEGDCQVWQGATQSKGYGCVGQGGKTLLAHRVVFYEFVGPVPEGMTIDHLCRNKLCMNVWHMEIVTREENSRRKNAARTHCARNHPLTGDNVRLQTRKNGLTYRVCRSCVRIRKLGSLVRYDPAEVQAAIAAAKVDVT